ncbi:MAG: methyltransferase family protein [Myxococcota bacterium]
MQVGAWLFKHRGWLPVPLLLAMLTARPRFWEGLALWVAGEAVRLWAVGHIGLPSRTRGDGVAGLVDTGPYARLRNPLYVGNLLLWAGLGVVLWPWALVAVPLLAVYYARIVAWEEENLLSRIGAPYAAYCARVPRWLPTGVPRPGRWDLARALRSERSTLLALAVVLALLFARDALG